MDYQKFKEDYESTGLSQKDYSVQKQMSPSMVSYYLRKAKEQITQNGDHGPSQFKPLKVEAKTSKTSGKIKLSLPLGIMIEIAL